MARPRVAPPSVDEYFEFVASSTLGRYRTNHVCILMCSQPVKIIVGSGPEKKTYTIPKDLLRHYSPYFRGAFNGAFREGVGGELRLADDNPKFFEVSLEYCCKGEAVYKPNGMERRSVQIAYCILFIKSCNIYDLGQVMEAVEGALARLLKCGAFKYLDTENISQVVNVLDHDSNIFKLLMQACVREMFREDAIDHRQNEFTTLMREDDAVAAGMMRELVVQKHGQSWVFTCPPLSHWKAWDIWHHL